MPRHRTPEEKRELGEQARVLRAAGRSRREIREQLEISDDLAKALLHDVLVPQSLRRPRAKDDSREAAVRMRLAGATYDEIAAELAVSKSTCSLWLRDLPAPDSVPHGKASLVPGAVGPEGQLPVGRSSARATVRRTQARELRREGYLLSEIAERLGVSVKTTYYDTLGIPVPPRGRPKGRTAEELRAAQRAYWDGENARRREQRAQVEHAAAAAVETVTRTQLHLMAVTAYWCEGSKSKPYDLREQVTFINSDLGLIRLWLAYLDDIAFPDEHRKFNLSIHESADVTAAERSWAADIGVAAERFGKPTIKRHNPKTVRLNTGESYRGCLVVRLTQCARLYRRISGTWTGIMEALPTADAVAIRDRPTQDGSLQRVHLPPRLPSDQGRDARASVATASRRGGTMNPR